MFCIILNSVIFTFYDYSDAEGKTPRNESLNAIGDLMTVVFIIEAMLKIAAQGFVMHRYSYLRDPWNLADFLIVLTG
jgi:hypothetical protein